MKNIFFTAACLAVTAMSFAESDPIVMTIEGVAIPKSEFEYIYNKNKSVATGESKSLDEYVDMFINYKMKIIEAKRENYDDKQNYLSEYDKYAKQLVIPFIRDEETEDALLQEALERKKESRLVSHILIKVKNDADSIKALKEINSIYDELQKGMDFSEAAKKYSQCPSSANGGSLGYIDVFSTVYPFETAAYNTSVGKYSKPIRTEYGYHIVKVFDVKPNYKARRVSHILIMNDKSGYDKRADSIFVLAKDGMDFEKLAKLYSEDSRTAKRGGDLGFVEESGYPTEFVKGVKNIAKVGDIVKIGTAFGIHIVKLTEGKEYETIADCPDLAERMKQSDRMVYSTKAFEEKLKQKYGVDVYPEALQIFEKIKSAETDSERVSLSFFNMDEPLYTMNGNTYPQSAFVNFFNKRLSTFKTGIRAGQINLENRKSGQLTMDNFVEQTFDAYLLRELVELEEKDWMRNDVNYRNLLTEYGDGLLLFEISNDKVWSKAVEDTAGLRKYYEENREKYKWENPHFKGVYACCKTEAYAKEIEDFMNKNSMKNLVTKVLNHFSDVDKDAVVARQGLYEKGTVPAVDYKVWGIEGYKSNVYPYVVVRGKVLAAPEEYKDVSGRVTADYQNYLDEQWVKSLRAKYKVEINKDVLKTIK